MYHLVCPAKYRKKVFTQEVENTLKETCVEIEKRYEINFIEIGADNDYIHFLFQSVPMLLLTRAVTLIKSITAREIFKQYPKLKKDILWGGSLWTSDYYINTVGKFSNEEMMKNYIKNQGVTTYQKLYYKKIYFNKDQLSLF